MNLSQYIEMQKEKEDIIKSEIDDTLEDVYQSLRYEFGKHGLDAWEILDYDGSFFGEICVSHLHEDMTYSVHSYSLQRRHFIDFMVMNSEMKKLLSIFNRVCFERRDYGKENSDRR